MDISSALLALAQVAVGLIGFSSVLIALSGEPGSWSALDKYRIIGLLASSICLLLLSLLPFVLSLLGVEDQIVWLSSAGVFAVLLIIGMVTNLRNYLRLSDSYRAAVRPPLVRAIYFVGTLVLMAELAAALGLLASPEGAYFAGLFFTLLLATYLIVRFLFARPNR